MTSASSDKGGGLLKSRRRYLGGVGVGAAVVIGAVLVLAVGAGVARGSFASAPDRSRVDSWLRSAADGHDLAAEAELQHWSDRGNTDARHALIRLLEHRPDSASESRRLGLLEQAVRDGDGWAATQLANRSLRRLGVLAAPAADASRRQITAWYRQGAAAGVPEAGRMLGVMLLDGSAGTTDTVAAREWLEKAAVAGDPPAMFLLANALRSGQGGQADEAAALRWYQRAADADFAPALQTLSLAYRYGELGLAVDRAQERLFDHEAAEALAHARAGGNQPSPSSDRRPGAATQSSSPSS